jgi:flagellar hook-associated protein 3 FlgL
MRIPTSSQYLSQASMISEQFNKMSMLYNQSVSGKKLTASSDNPSLSFQIKSHEEFVNLLQSYDDNGVLATSRSSLFGSSVQSLIDATSDIQTLVKQAQNGTINDRDRFALAQKMQGDLDNLVKLSNTKDANGEYIYSGMNSGSPAYVSINGSYQYQGGSTPMLINMSPNISVLYGEAGDSVFSHIYNGNGTFAVIADSANQGSAALAPGSATLTKYVPDQYTIQFVTNGDGKIGYQVTGVNSGQIIPPPPAVIPHDAPVFSPGTTISFNGVSIDASGEPANGDSFLIKPSTPQNAFDAVQNIISILKTPVTNQSTFKQLMTQADATLSQVLTRFTHYQSDVGTRSANIEEQNNINKNTISQQKISLSNLADVDLPSVISAMAQQSLILQATQESYLKMQSLLEKMMASRS